MQAQQGGSSWLRRLIGRYGREALLYSRVLAPRTSPRVAFLPSSGREQSGLQRAYLIAEQLDSLGWQTVVIPKHLLAGQRDRLLGRFAPQLVVLQKCRHPLNRLEYLQHWPLVLDVDDADYLDPDLAQPMADIARAARGVICGSRFIQEWAQVHAANTEVIWTGSPVTEGPWPAHAERGRIVTWAQSNPLTSKAELAFVEEIILRAHARTSPFVFRLYGWRWPQDHARLARLRQAGVTLELVPPLPYGAFLQSLRDVAVGVSAIVGTGFSQGKSFGKILGYLDAKVPVVCSDGADHAAFFTAATGVVSNDPQVWVRDIVALLDDPARRERMAAGAHETYCAHLDIRAAARKTAAFLARTRSPDPHSVQADPGP